MLCSYNFMNMLYNVIKCYKNSFRVESLLTGYCLLTGDMAGFTMSEPSLAQSEIIFSFVSNMYKIWSTT